VLRLGLGLELAWDSVRFDVSVRVRNTLRFALTVRICVTFQVRVRVRLSAAVGVPTIIETALPVRRLLSLVVYSIFGMCELNRPTICHVEKPTFTSK